MNNHRLILVLLFLVLGFLTTHAQTQDEYVNIAPAAMVRSSGQYSSAYPTTAVNDGDMTTLWGSPTSDSPQWIYFDLGEVKLVDGYRLHWFDPYYANEYQVYISNDLQSWIKVHEVIAGAGGTEEVIVTYECRYIGVYLTQKNMIAYGLKEFEILKKDARVTAYFKSPAEFLLPVFDGDELQLFTFEGRTYFSYVEYHPGVKNLRIGVMENDGIIYIEGSSLFPVDNPDFLFADCKFYELNDKLYISWITEEYIHFAVYNGDDAAPGWTMLDTLSSKAEANSRSHSYDTIVFNNELYALSTIMNKPTRLVKYNGDDQNPSWIYVSDLDRVDNCWVVEIDKILYAVTSFWGNLSEMHYAIYRFDAQDNSWTNIFTYTGELNMEQLFDVIAYNNYICLAFSIRPSEKLPDLPQVYAYNTNSTTGGLIHLKNGSLPSITEYSVFHGLKAMKLGMYKGNLYLLWTQGYDMDEFWVDFRVQGAVFNGKFDTPDWKHIDKDDKDISVRKGLIEWLGFYHHESGLVATVGQGRLAEDVFE